MTPSAAPPHAWVVEHRPLDACRPPACVLSTRAAQGRVEAGGGYVVVGDDQVESFARRGVVLAPGEALTFTLPASRGPERLDVDLAVPGGGDFAVVTRLVPAGGAPSDRRDTGRSEPWAPRAAVDELGREERHFSHVTSALPAHESGALEITLANDGASRVALGAPTVLRRIEGRAARQAFLFFVDAVPWPALSALFAGADDPAARWVARWVAQGSLFARGESPGQLTGSFVRRFFGGAFYRLDGEPSLAGQGFDDEPPARAPGPVARLVEQGFVTAAIGSNLYLSPLLGRVGFDATYDIESTLELQVHPAVVARRFDAWMAAHADDDQLVVAWLASTHAPWRAGRIGAPPLVVPGAGAVALDRDVLDPVWRNLLEGADTLRAMHDAADARSPSADRLFVVATDHGHSFTRDARERPYRLTGEVVSREHQHCCMAAQQEAQTPFAVVHEGGSGARPAATRVESPTSTLAVWRLVERHLDARLELPDTSSFDLPGAARFDDGVVVSVGDSGALAAVRGSLAYRSYQPALGLLPLASASPAVARLLQGASVRDGDVVAEELYDLASDPFEQRDVASHRFDDLLAMRRHVTDWLAEWSPPEGHARSRSTLRFAGPVTLTLDAPRPYRAAIDAGPLRDMPTHATLVASRLDLEDGDAPLGVVDLGGAAVDAGLSLRCASSALPLAALGPGAHRLNLALARTNCPGDDGGAAVPPGFVAFGTSRVTPQTPGASGAVVGGSAVLGDALRRWGYVRGK